MAERLGSDCIPRINGLGYFSQISSHWLSELTMEQCRAALAVFIGSQPKPQNRHVPGSRSEVATFLPTFCPECNEPAMEVVEHRPNDSYEARWTACGCHTFVKISPELLITKHAIDSTR